MTPPMERALALAQLGWGRVQPNPLVGAVVVGADGQVIGEGYHQEYGGPHAEVHALASAGEAARGATLYVTLEPCSHHGKTPPCTDAILKAGIARVIIGAHDPNPAARGGAAVLRKAGVSISGPVAERAVQRQNAIFFHAHKVKNTFVALKLAVSLDGRIAASRGQRTAITGEEAQNEVHRLRAGYDAIMVGSGTVLADDPLLTVRGDVTPLQPPVRVVIDSQLQLRPDSRLVRTIELAPVWVFCSDTVGEKRRGELEALGVRVTTVTRSSAGLDLNEVLDVLWRSGLKSVFCEGGARVAGSLARAGRVDRFHVFVAPVLLGPDAVNAFDSLPPPDRLPLELDGVERFGPDVLLTYDRTGHSSFAGRPITEAVKGYVYRFG